MILVYFHGGFWAAGTKEVSPLNYVRAGLPPILSIHGDADRVVPYQHGVRLHEALNKVGVPNRSYPSAPPGLWDRFADRIAEVVHRGEPYVPE